MDAPPRAVVYGPRSVSLLRSERMLWRRRLSCDALDAVRRSLLLGGDGHHRDWARRRARHHARACVRCLSRDRRQLRAHATSLSPSATAPERCRFSIIVILIGVVLYAVIIGSASSALANLDSGNTERRKKVEAVQGCVDAATALDGRGHGALGRGADLRAPVLPTRSPSDAATCEPTTSRKISRNG